MGRAPCCSKVGMHRGAWTPREDNILVSYIQAHGHENWRSLPKKAGLKRCGKSCRLRWMNYLRPNIRRGNITPDEEDLIIKMHALLGNRWSIIAGRLPGRTDNEIKNYWNSIVSKKLREQGIDPCTHRKLTEPGQYQTTNPKKNQASYLNSINNNRKITKVNLEPEKQKIYYPKAVRLTTLTLPITNDSSQGEEGEGSFSNVLVADDFLNVSDIEFQNMDAITTKPYNNFDELLNEFLQLVDGSPTV